MDIGSVFLILALLVLVGLFVSQPFLDRKRVSRAAQSDVKDHEISSLLAERDRVLNALQELDFDYTLGKIPEEDYAVQRPRLVAYGADVLRQLDELEVETNKLAAGAQIPSAQDRIEAAIAARRMDAVRAGITPHTGSNGGKVVSAAIAAPDEDIEVMLANHRRSRQSDSTGFCPNCGTALQKTDKFCSKCGTKIN